MQIANRLGLTKNARNSTKTQRELNSHGGKNNALAVRKKGIGKKIALS